MKKGVPVKAALLYDLAGVASLCFYIFKGK